MLNDVTTHRPNFDADLLAYIIISDLGDMKTSTSDLLAQIVDIAPAANKDAQTAKTSAVNQLFSVVVGDLVP
jgi:hypothetical protein